MINSYFLLNNHPRLNKTMKYYNFFTYFVFKKNEIKNEVAASNYKHYI